MRRYLIVAAVVIMVGSDGRAAFAQRQPGRSTANQGFQVGQNTGGQGASGNFGVGTAGQVDTNARYMRDNRQGAFVGADSADTGFVGSAAAGNTQNSNRNIRRGGGGRTNVNQGGRGNRQRDEIRVVLQLGFTPPQPNSIAPKLAPGAVASRLAERMERSSWIQNRSPLKVSIDQGTATLRGVVATEHDRVLAERLALLEGGVRKVENLLELESKSPDAQDAPALLQPTPGT